MSEGPEGRGPRATAATPDGPEGLWARLRVATAEARDLAGENRALRERVASLEAQLGRGDGGGGGRDGDRGHGDDDDGGDAGDGAGVDDLPLRMHRALESAQELADALVARAKRREAVVRRRTDERAAAVVHHAETEATAILRSAADEAVRTVGEARAEVERLVAGARARRERVLAELEGESAELEHRLRKLRRLHHELAAAYDVVERTVAEARAALARHEAAPLGAPRPERPERPAANGAGDRNGRRAPAPSRPLPASVDDTAPYGWSPPLPGVV